MNIKFCKIVAAMGLFMVMGVSAYGQLTVTNNLQLWLRSDMGVQTSGTSVTNWLDQSGQGNHASPDAVASRPTLVSGALNGLPVVQFDGINDRLRAADAAGLDGGPGMTIFVVAKPFTFGSYPELVAKWDYAGGGGSGSYAFEIEASQTLFAFVRSGPGDGGNNYRSSSPATPIQSEFSNLSVLYDGSQAANADRLKFFRNGVLLPDGGGGGTIATNLQDSTSPLTIGDFPNLNRYFDGQMAEVLLYNTTLSATERQDVVEYLNAKWAIPEASALTYLSLSGLAWLAVILRRR